MMIKRFIFALPFLISTPVLAKPVTWPGGTQVMIMNDQDMNAVHALYTLTPTTAIQNRADYMRDDETMVGGLQINHLVKRWNMPGGQANIYGSLGAGIAHQDDETAPAGFAGLLADYETRRFIISYEGDGIAAPDVTNQIWHRARIGFAPYEGEYDDLHTWIMLQTDYRPNVDHEIGVMPMVRVFKTDFMIEGGMNQRGEAMFNFILQY